MQKVEMYNSLVEAKFDMEKHIIAGWYVHTCTMAEYMAGFNNHKDILVVYESINDQQRRTK